MGKTNGSSYTSDSKGGCGIIEGLPDLKVNQPYNSYSSTYDRSLGYYSRNRDYRYENVRESVIQGGMEAEVRRVMVPVEFSTKGFFSFVGLSYTVSCDKCDTLFHYPLLNDAMTTEEMDDFRISVLEDGWIISTAGDLLCSACAKKSKAKADEDAMGKTFSLGGYDDEEIDLSTEDLDDLDDFNALDSGFGDEDLDGFHLPSPHNLPPEIDDNDFTPAQNAFYEGLEWD